MNRFRRGTRFVAVTVTAVLALSACGQSKDKDNDSANGGALVVGTTDKVVSIDPAGSYDNGSLNVQTQVYQYLLNFPEGSTS
ncbi:hypothetical protein [Aeromicrobium sp. UC242_57]|uniref:hypothetical protein n=1 Tax=Aeromicrobium sp. UC242_57 TaxID=3374624 RepID=UPI00379713D7